MHTERVRVRQEGTRTIRVSRDFFIDVPFHIHNDPTLLTAWVQSLEQGGDPIEYWTPHGEPHIELIRTTVVEQDSLAEFQRTLSSMCQ